MFQKKSLDQIYLQKKSPRLSISSQKKSETKSIFQKISLVKISRTFKHRFFPFEKCFFYRVWCQIWTPGPFEAPKPIYIQKKSTRLNISSKKFPQTKYICKKKFPQTTYIFKKNIQTKYIFKKNPQTKYIYIQKKSVD